MRLLGALALISLACSGAIPPPRDSRAEYPAAAPCPACPEKSCPTRAECPDAACPTCPSPYSETQGWYCIDDSAGADKTKAYSYCWTRLEHCEFAYERFMKDRPGELERCRPYTPAYCFEQHSVLLHHRRYHCAATMEHCENGRRSVQKDVKPEDEYTISPCTEHP